MTEVRVRRASGDDQRVVANRWRRGHLADRPQVDLARVEVEVRCLCQEHADVAVALEDRPDWIGDLAGAERTGRDLIGQRLEQMEVAPVDERHVNRTAMQLLHGLEAAEAAADHDHAVSGCGGAHSAGRYRGVAGVRYLDPPSPT